MSISGNLALLDQLLRFRVGDVNHCAFPVDAIAGDKNGVSDGWLSVKNGAVRNAINRMFENALAFAGRHCKWNSNHCGRAEHIYRRSHSLTVSFRQWRRPGSTGGRVLVFYNGSPLLRIRPVGPALPDVFHPCGEARKIKPKRLSRNSPPTPLNPLRST